MSRPEAGIVLGFHGCSGVVAQQLLAGADFRPSAKDFDWLGPGAYFWENDARRALEWAREKEASRPGSCPTPSVVGAVIMLGQCLDLTLRDDLDLLADAYDSLCDARQVAGLEMPRNKEVPGDPYRDRKLRYLDCAVINHLERNITAEAEEARLRGEVAPFRPIQTVRGLFIEGGDLYPGSGFTQKTHGQIAVVDPTCILGVFRPRPYP